MSRIPRFSTIDRGCCVLQRVRTAAYKKLGSGLQLGLRLGLGLGECSSVRLDKDIRDRVRV